MKFAWLAAGIAPFAVFAADSPTPTGLALVQARYTGVWQVEETAFDTEFSRAGSKEYELTRECALAGAVLDCKLMAEGALQGEQRFSWDATAGVYRVDMDIGGRPQPPLTLNIKDASWTFLVAIHDRDGKPLQYRILRQYRTDTEVSYSAGYSRDGVGWTLMTRGTEIRKAATKN